MCLGLRLLLVAVILFSSSIQARSGRIMSLAGKVLPTKVVAGKVLATAAVIGTLVCGNMACEKIQQPMVEGFTQSGQPSGGQSNVAYYRDTSQAAAVYRASTLHRSVSIQGDEGESTSVSPRLSVYDRTANFRDFRVTIGSDDYYGVIADQSSGGWHHNGDNEYLVSIGALEASGGPHRVLSLTARPRNYQVWKRSNFAGLGNAS